MKTLEDELRALCPLDWQPSSMRPAGFELFTAGMALRGLVTVQGARAGAVLVVKAEVASASLRHYFVCSSDSRGAERVTSGPDLAGEFQRAAQMDAGIRAALAARPKRGFNHLATLLSDRGATLAFTPMEDGHDYSATVRFPNGGTAHTDGSRGDLLGAVIGAVECHVGVDDEPETEFERAAVNIARDDVERGDVVSLDDAKVSLARGEE